MSLVFDALLSQAKLFGIGVVQGHYYSEYNPHTNLIYLGPEIPECPELLLAHELGHYMDLSCMSEKHREYSNKAVGLLLDYGDLGVKQFIIRREINAWNNGRTLLKIFGFTNWSLFRKEKKRAVKSYMEFGEFNMIG